MEAFTRKEFPAGQSNHLLPECPLFIRASLIRGGLKHPTDVKVAANSSRALQMRREERLRDELAKQVKQD